MRLLINAQPLSAGGGRTVGLDVVRAAVEASGDLDITAVVPKGVGYEEVLQSSRVRAVYCPRRALNGLWRVWFDQVWLPRLVRSTRADALLTLGNVGPVRSGCRQITLLHNPFLVYPWRWIRPFLTLGSGVSVATQRALLRMAMADISAYVVQTEVMRDRLASILRGIEPRIHIIPNLVRPVEVAVETGAVRVKPALRNRFRVLVLARYYAHKGLETVLEIAALIAQQGEAGFEFVLTIAPSDGPGARRLLRNIRTRGLAGVIRNIGPQSLEGLKALHESCDCALSLSRLESSSGSFVDAMRFGLPIIAPDMDFARASCGEAAVYARDWRPESFMEALNAVRRDREMANRLIEHGRERLRQMEASRPSTGCELIRLCQEVVGEQGGLSGRNLAHGGATGAKEASLEARPSAGKAEGGTFAR